MKTINAYTIREYDVRYTVVLDETDPLVQAVLAELGFSVDDWDSLEYPELREIWDSLLVTPGLKVDVEENPGSERFVAFD